MQTGKILLIMLVAFAALSNASLITSAGRDFSTGVWDSSQGKWHYEAKYNGNGSTSTVTMAYDIPNSRWSEGYLAGNGFVTNASAVFGAQTGVTLVVDPGTTGGTHPFPHNTTVNWTSNFTGKINVTGWMQRTPIVLQNYNFTLWLNGNLNQTIIGTDSSNISFSAMEMDIIAGDYLAATVSSVIIDKDVYLNLTMYVEANLSSGTTPTGNLNVDKLNYTETELANLTVSIPNIAIDSNVSSNFSIKYANGTVVWNIERLNLTQTNTIYISKSIPVGFSFIYKQFE